jgi:hypothetical protein
MEKPSISSPANANKKKITIRLGTPAGSQIGLTDRSEAKTSQPMFESGLKNRMSSSIDSKILSHSQVVTPTNSKLEISGTTPDPYTSPNFKVTEKSLLLDKSSTSRSELSHTVPARLQPEYFQKVQEQQTEVIK